MSLVEVLRVWILFFGLGVIIVYAKSLWNLNQHAREQKERERARGGRELVIGHLQSGRYFRLIAALILMIEEWIDVIQRWPNENFSWETILYSLSLIFFLLAWHHLDRRNYRDVDDGIDNLARKLHES